MNSKSTSSSEWYGDSTNGIEIRKQGGEIDEVLLYVNGKCVTHLETMSDKCVFAWFQVQGQEVTANLCAEDSVFSEVYREDSGAKLSFKLQEVNQLDREKEWINKKN